MTRKPSATPAADASEEDTYEVGYGKPPKHTRFKPGQSGNPKGRPRGAPNLRTVFTKAVQETVTIREGDKTRNLSKARAIIQVTLNKGLKGDPKGLAAIVQLARMTGLMDEEPDTAANDNLSAQDQEIIAEFLERHGSEPPEIDAEDEDEKPEGQA